MSTAKAWKCEVCGYIHDGPEPPATCPVCGVGPELFVLFAPAEEEPAADGPTSWRCVVCDYVHQGPEPPDECPVCAAGRDMFEPVEEVSDAAGAPADTAQGLTGPRIVVLGAGIAGVTAAENARRVAPFARITLLSKEPLPPYYRLNLTRFVAGEVDEPALHLHPESWYADKQLELVTGEAASIQRDRRQVALTDGGRLGYDALVLANGSHPFVPPILGVTRESVFCLRTLQDARRLVARAGGGAKVVCVGGGLLGLEIAGALNRRGCQVTVMEGFDWLLPRQLARPAGELLQQHLEELGIAIRCAVRVKEITGDEAARGVTLEEGETVEADVVAVAAGVRPNSYLARQSELQVRTGVVVDDRLCTSDPAIFAAGDVAEHRGVMYGLWGAAFAQGAVAGANAAGGSDEFCGMAPSTMLKVLDVRLFSIGQFEPNDGSYQVYEGTLSSGGHYRLVCHDGRIVGANLLGDTSLANAIKDAVDGSTQISELTLLKNAVPGLGSERQTAENGD